MFILKKYLKSFGYALFGKILLRCLFNKFNLYKILLVEPRYVLKFAFASANVSGIFNLFRWVVQTFKIKIDIYLELFIAGCLSSLALRDFQATELSILKVLVYPRAIENVWELFKSKVIELSDNHPTVIKIMNPYRGESVICAILISISVYAWAFEP